MKSGDARVALIGFPSVGKVCQHGGRWVVFPGLDVEDKGVCACLPLIMSLFFHNPTMRKQGKF